MNSLQNFNPAEITPTVMDLIPNGWYDCEIVEVNLKPTKGPGDNERLSFRFKIIGEQFTNRQFYSGLNVKNSNAQAQEYAQKDLSAICHATGVMSFANAGVEQFVGKNLQVLVGTGKTSKAYPDPQNEGKGYKAIKGAGVAVVPPAFAAPAPVVAAPATPVAAPVAPPVVTASPIDSAIADGWLAHPQSPGYFYKGSDVILEADLVARYPAVPAVPVAPAAPEVPVVPPAPPAPEVPVVPAETTGAKPPWVNP